MNMGQLLETHLGLAAKKAGIYVKSPVFEGFPEQRILGHDDGTRLPEDGKFFLYDGVQVSVLITALSVGYIYNAQTQSPFADKIHARSIGPYSLVTQQPLGGKAQMGGQRFRRDGSLGFGSLWSRSRSSRDPYS